MLPVDWNDWRRQWEGWEREHRDELVPSLSIFPGKNFLADEVLGTYEVKGRMVELSEVTMPDFGGRPCDRVRLIGVTFGIGLDADGITVRSFEELEEVLGL